MTRQVTAAALPERFWAKVDLSSSSGCWVWTAYRNDWGYGEFKWRDKVQRAHRVSYSVLVGPIPEGLVIDHLCRNRACVNPAHLEPVTNAENVRRNPFQIGDLSRNKTHCPRGHEYSEENTLRPPSSGARNCRECQRLGRIERGEQAPDAVACKDRVRCVNGHDYTPENTYRRPNGERYCRTCKNAKARETRRSAP